MAHHEWIGCVERRRMAFKDHAPPWRVDPSPVTASRGCVSPYWGGGGSCSSFVAGTRPEGCGGI